MALGEGAGRTFLFNQRGQAVPQQQKPNEADSEPEINPMGEGLRATSANITDYYQAYGNLNAYAKSMWKTHGFDVTQADYSDPEKIKAHDVYLQGAAYVNELNNKLKREASMEDVAYKQSVADPNFRQGDQAGLDTYDPTLDVQLKTTQRVTGANKLAGVYSDRDLVSERNDQIRKVRDAIEKELEIETVPSRVQELENELNGLQMASYDPNKDEDQNSLRRYRAAQLAKKDTPDKPTDYTARPLEIQEAQSGGIGKIKTLRGGDKKLIYSSVIHNAALGKIFLTRADSKETEVIDLRSDDGGREALNTVMNVGQSEKVTSAQLEGLDKDLGVIGTGDKQGLPNISLDTYKQADKVVEDTHSREGSTFADAVKKGNKKLEFQMSFVPGTKDNKNVVIAPDTKIIDFQRGSWFAGSWKKFFLTYEYIDEDGKKQTEEKTFNLDKPKDNREFNKLVLFNADKLGVDVKPEGEIDPTLPTQEPGIEEKTPGGKIIIPGVSPSGGN